MQFKETNIKGCYLIELSPFQDERGFFTRLFSEDIFKSMGIDFHIKQVNQSFNNKKGTFRGMHFQKPPFDEAKLIKCISGSIIDYVIDLRSDSSTFLQSARFELSADKFTMLFIPKGLAHGFLTLENNTSLLYYHDTNYNPNSEFGIRFNDPKINLSIDEIIENISIKDTIYPLLTSNFKGFQI